MAGGQRRDGTRGLARRKMRQSRWDLAEKDPKYLGSGLLARGLYRRRPFIAECWPLAFATLEVLLQGCQRLCVFSFFGTACGGLRGESRSHPGTRG